MYMKAKSLYFSNAFIWNARGYSDAVKFSCNKIQPQLKKVKLESQVFRITNYNYNKKIYIFGDYLTISFENILSFHNSYS